MGAPLLPAQQPQGYLAGPVESMLARAEPPGLRTADIDIHLQPGAQGVEGQRPAAGSPSCACAIGRLARAGPCWAAAGGASGRALDLAA